MSIPAGCAACPRLPNSIDVCAGMGYTLWKELKVGPANHLLENGCDIRTVQELLDHKNVKTTVIYAHVLNRGGHGVRS